MVVLVGGHESADGVDLYSLEGTLPGVSITPPGRRLHNLLTRGLEEDGGPIVVLPMTFGRNPTMVSDTAKTLRWLSTGKGRGRLALSEPFGTTDHLVAWLRMAATNISKRNPGAAVVVTARKANPFDDAELYRIAHLVRTHGAGNEVEVACMDHDDGVLDALRRLRLLGFPTAVVVPAGFSTASRAPLGADEFSGASFYGPLMNEEAVLRVIADRVKAAVHSLSHGHDGIDYGLLADHGHGYAHSHAFEEAQHGHSHAHPHGVHESDTSEPTGQEAILHHHSS